MLPAILKGSNSGVYTAPARNEVGPDETSGFCENRMYCNGGVNCSGSMSEPSRRRAHERSELTGMRQMLQMRQILNCGALVLEIDVLLYFEIKKTVRFCTYVAYSSNSTNSISESSISP